MLFRPVPLVPESKCIVHQGKVSAIFEGGMKDVVIRTENSEKRFYINRGLENGLQLDSLRKKLLGQSVTIKYPPYWTPFDPKNKVKHISMLKFDEEVIFSELK